MDDYDTYGRLEIQLKIGYPIMREYEVGDKVPLSDGVYLGYEGIVVVVGGVFVAEFKTHLFSKWGNEIDYKKVLDDLSPVIQAIREENKKK